MGTNTMNAWIFIIHYYMQNVILITVTVTDEEAIINKLLNYALTKTITQ